MGQDPNWESRGDLTPHFDDPVDVLFRVKAERKDLIDTVGECLYALADCGVEVRGVGFHDVEAHLATAETVQAHLGPQARTYTRIEQPGPSIN